MSLKHLGDQEQSLGLPRILCYIVLCLPLQVHHNYQLCSGEHCQMPIAIIMMDLQGKTENDITENAR